MVKNNNMQFMFAIPQVNLIKQMIKNTCHGDIMQATWI